MNYYQFAGGNCSLCGSPGSTKITCPLNPNAKNPNPEKHPNALIKSGSTKTNQLKKIETSIAIEKLINILTNNLYDNDKVDKRKPLPLQKVYTIATNFFNAKKIELYEDLNGLNTNIDGNKYYIGTKCQDWNLIPNDVIRNHLHQFPKLTYFSYTTRFPGKTIYNFLVKAPPNLKTLEVTHLYDLEPSFTKNITTLKIKQDIDEVDEIGYITNDVTKIYKNITKLVNANRQNIKNLINDSIKKDLNSMFPNTM